MSDRLTKPKKKRRKAVNVKLTGADELLRHLRRLPSRIERVMRDALLKTAPYQPPVEIHVQRGAKAKVR